MFDVITFGSATRDIMVRPKKVTPLKYEKGISAEVCFPFGSKIDVEEMQFSSGGGGTNTVVTFAKQGFKAAFCGLVGKDLAGQELVGELKSLRVDTRLVAATPERLTNHSVVILGDQRQDRTILAYRGASELLDVKNIPFRKLKARWLYLAPMSGLLCDSFEQLVLFAKDRGMNVAVNPGMAQLSLPHFAQIAQYIDILLLNQEEASFLTKIPVDQEKEIFKKIDELCPGIAVMTRGAEGVVVSDGKHLYSAKPPAQRLIVDTTGAGDAFGSGFVAEYMRNGGNIEKAVQFGMANSVGCLSQVGAKNGLLKKGEPFESVPVAKEVCDNNVCMVK